MNKRNGLFVGVVSLLIICTLYNTYGLAHALYYKEQYQDILHATPYPYMKKINDDETAIKIENHNCISYKSLQLLKCE